jgi:hypothetical protein
MIFSRHFITTNQLGAETLYKIGSVVTARNERWLITKHKLISTVPQITIQVFGRRITP